MADRKTYQVVMADGTRLTVLAHGSRTHGTIPDVAVTFHDEAGADHSCFWRPIGWWEVQRPRNVRVDHSAH